MSEPSRTNLTDSFYVIWQKNLIIGCGKELADNKLISSEKNDEPYFHQYATGNGSRLRQRYQVATVRHGRHRSP